MKRNNINIKDLNALAIDEKPFDYDYRDHNYPEDWEIAFGRTEEEYEDELWEPMMNYRYRVPEFKRHMKEDKAIKESLDKAGSVTLIRDNTEEEYYLALTGGGMDLSWDICRGYINLGYLPPVHFCNLPNFASETYDKTVVDACRKSVDIMRFRLGSIEKNLDLIIEDKTLFKIT